MSRVRLADVAREAGVSYGTASNTFNRPDRVRPAVRARVEAAAARLGYCGPDPAARVLRAGKVGSVGVVTSNDLAYFFDDPFAQQFMAAVADTCAAHGAGVSLISTREAERAAWTIDSALVDGFLLLCAEDSDPLVARARRRGLPYVTVDHPDGVAVDDEGGAYEVARHLLSLGHRRIGVLAYGGGLRYCGACSVRLAGYARAVAEAGLPPETLWVADTGDDKGAIGRALDDFLAASAPVTAVLAMSDRIALRAMALARQRGMAVPDDLSVAGFDDVAAAAQSDPPLTSVHQPIGEKARLAAARLFAASDAAPAPGVVLPVRLIVRGSTAPPPATPH